MPVIMVDTLDLREPQKKAIAQKFTQILAQETRVPEDRIYVFFGGLPLDGIAAGGVLNSELPQSVIDSFDTKYSSPSTPGVTVITRMRARDGQVDAARQAFPGFLAATRQEPGTLRYDVYQQNFDDLACFLLYEEWKDWDAIGAHMSTDHFKAFMGQAGELFETLEEVNGPFEVMIAQPYDPAAPLPAPATLALRMRAAKCATDAARQGVLALLQKTRPGSGVLACDPYQNIEAGHDLIVFERFADGPALAAYLASEAFTTFQAKTAACLEGACQLLTLTLFVPEPQPEEVPEISVEQNAVLGDEKLMAGLRQLNPAFGELCINASGAAYATPLLDQKTKVLLAIATDVMEQITGKPFENHLQMAFKQGITRAELEELFLFLSVYAGFNKTGVFLAALDKLVSPELVTSSLP